jgi:hypothetical protein
MPQGGSFPNIPDMPVGGSDLFANKATTYKDYICSSVQATGDTKTFTYIPRAGVAAMTITVGAAIGDKLDMIINPAQLMSANDVMFLCSSCDCDQPMTGTTAFDKTGYGGILTGGTKTWEVNANTAFAPTIIGGSGLNN